MPIYTASYPMDVTLCNDLREGNPNPFVDKVLTDLSYRNVIEYKLTANQYLADGEAQNYQRPYYSDLFSAPTTAGFTQITQTQYVTKFGVIYGHQTGVPAIR